LLTSLFRHLTTRATGTSKTNITRLWYKGFTGVLLIGEEEGGGVYAISSRHFIMLFRHVMFGTNSVLNKHDSTFQEIAEIIILT